MAYIPPYILLENLREKLRINPVILMTATTKYPRVYLSLLEIWLVQAYHEGLCVCIANLLKHKRMYPL